MKITVRLFARARDLAGSDSVILDLSTTATVGDLRERLATTCPSLGVLIAHSALAVNNEYADDSLRLAADAEVALLPPVSGG